MSCCGPSCSTPMGRQCPKCGSKMNKVEYPDEDEDFGTKTWWVCENDNCGHSEKVNPNEK